MKQINKSSFSYKLNQHTFGEKAVIETETVLGYTFMTIASVIAWSTIFVMSGFIVYYAVLFPYIAASVVGMLIAGVLAALCFLGIIVGVSTLFIYIAENLEIFTSSKKELIMINKFLLERKLEIFLNRKENQKLRDDLYVQSMTQLNLKRNVNFITAVVLIIGIFACGLTIPVTEQLIPFFTVAAIVCGWCLFRVIYLFICGMDLFDTGFNHNLFLKFLKENKEKYEEFERMGV